MRLCAITDRSLFGAPEDLVEQAALWAKGGVEFVQIREKDLADAELVTLATAIVHAVRAVGGSTRVLLNGPVHIAAATGCDGVHFPADRSDSAIVEAKNGLIGSDPFVSVSCHTLSEIARARDGGASLVLFAPVFEKWAGTETIPGQGLDALARACRVARPMPVFALGGVTVANAAECIRAGASGIAAIRLFASDDWRSLRTGF